MSLGGDGTGDAVGAAGDGGGMEAATVNVCCPTLTAASDQHRAALARGAVSSLPNTGSFTSSKGQVSPTKLSILLKDLFGNSIVMDENLIIESCYQRFSFSALTRDVFPSSGVELAASRYHQSTLGTYATRVRRKRFPTAFVIQAHREPWTARWREMVGVEEEIICSTFHNAFCFHSPLKHDF